LAAAQAVLAAQPPAPAQAAPKARKAG